MGTYGCSNATGRMVSTLGTKPGGVWADNAAAMSRSSRMRLGISMMREVASSSKQAAPERLLPILWS